LRNPAKERSGTIENTSKPMSFRGVAFQVVYVLSASAAWFNTCTSMDSTNESPIFASIMSVHWLTTFILVHMILLLHSAGTRMPKQQPCRLLMLLMRAVMVLLTVDAIAYFGYDLRKRYLFKVERILGVTATAASRGLQHPKAR